ncbi:MAG: hypothetical protein K2P57_05800 [Burkholderiales bacterium]|nr:hypothetical protein [Burkholderiales bacterium]
MAVELTPDFGKIRGEFEADSIPGNLFSPLKVPVSRTHADKMAAIIAAIESVAAIPGYREMVLQWAPSIAAFDPGTRGVFFGYDFHIGESGPRLIEINTNAGGAYLNALLARAWGESGNAEEAFFDMFMEEWSLVRGGRKLSHVAIVDDDCFFQFLYPEFVLFRNLFVKHAISAVIAEAKDLEFRDGVLYHDDIRVDLVYNRLTDFSLEAHPALKAAYLAGAVVLTPHPRAHALFADKRNLSVLTDPASLVGFGLSDASVELLLGGIAKTRIVENEDPDELWRERRRLFFKPGSGYASKAVYRGEKLTKRVWEEILKGPYVAQEFVPPPEIEGMKYDYRNFAYKGRIQLLAARLYQGQTTNFRTTGGGFAPVVIE